MCVNLVRHFGKDWIDRQQEGLVDDFEVEYDELSPSLPQSEEKQQEEVANQPCEEKELSKA